MCKHFEWVLWKYKVHYYLINIFYVLIYYIIYNNIYLFPIFKKCVTLKYTNNLLLIILFYGTVVDTFFWIILWNRNLHNIVLEKKRPFCMNLIVIVTHRGSRSFKLRCILLNFSVLSKGRRWVWVISASHCRLYIFFFCELIIIYNLLVFA